MEVTLVIDGVPYAMQPVAAPAPAPAPAPVVVQTAPQPVSSSLKLSFTDPAFAGNVSASSTTVKAGGTISNKRITDTGSTASVVFLGGGKMDGCNIKSQEGVRLGGGGVIEISGSYIETTGKGGDHADGIQAYSGARTDLIATDTVIVSHNANATAGVFFADNSTGDVTLDNVVFQGGPFGLRLHADVGGDINVFAKDVFFVGPFGEAPFYFLDYGGHKVIVKQWDNVRWATIVNGVLVPGNLIPQP